MTLRARQKLMAKPHSRPIPSDAAAFQKAERNPDQSDTSLSQLNVPEINAVANLLVAARTSSHDTGPSRPFAPLGRRWTMQNMR
jgi:hypothetical protein